MESTHSSSTVYQSIAQGESGAQYFALFFRCSAQDTGGTVPPVSSGCSDWVPERERAGRQWAKPKFIIHNYDCLWTYDVPITFPNVGGLGDLPATSIVASRSWSALAARFG